MAQLDLDELSQHYQITIATLEDSTERAHRHRLEWLRTWFNQGIHGLLVVFALAMVVLLAWYCLGLLMGSVTVSGASPAVTGEAQKWAMAILSAIASGLIGFLTGKAVK